MGNCWGTNEDDKNGEVRHTTNHTSMHEGFIRERNLDVYKKYEEMEVLGKGSMGHVARVQVREGAEGGSAFNSSSHGKRNPKLPPGSTSSTLSEKRKHKVDYALKSIQLDRVSPQFLEELRNEIDILKGMVGVPDRYRRWSIGYWANLLTERNESSIAPLFPDERIIPTLSKPTKSTSTRSKSTLFSSCVTAGTCTLGCRIQRSERRVLRMTSFRLSNICTIMVLYIG